METCSKDKAKAKRKSPRTLGFKKRSFWDYLLDMYSLPEDLDFHLPPTGLMGARRLNRGIENNFQDALERERLNHGKRKIGA